MSRDGRDKQLIVRVTDDERELIRKRALSAGYATSSDYVRSSVLGETPKAPLFASLAERVDAHDHEISTFEQRVRQLERRINEKGR